MAVLAPYRLERPEKDSVALDETHLGRMTMGDRRLEREVLEIFARQIDLMLARMSGADPALAAAAAHTLKGSARGIGAWDVAQAAETVEQASQQGGDQVAAAIIGLQQATARVIEAIDARLAVAERR